jgi:hypothetical protein
VNLKGLVFKTNWLAVNRQSKVNPTLVLPRASCFNISPGFAPSPRAQKFRHILSFTAVPTANNGNTLLYYRNNEAVVKPSLCFLRFHGYYCSWIELFAWIKLSW